MGVLPEEKGEKRGGGKRRREKEHVGWGNRMFLFSSIYNETDVITVLFFLVILNINKLQ